MEKKVVLIRDLSTESEQAEIILKENGISHLQVMSFSNDSTPSLVTDESSFSYSGVEEIKEYVEKYKMAQLKA